MRPYPSNVTRLAKAILASHLELGTGGVARPVAWKIVEERWARADQKDRADYRREARHVLRTLAAEKSRG